MISQATFMGGAVQKDFTGTVSLDPRSAYAWRLDGSSTPIVTLPDARDLIPDKQAHLWNAGATAITVKDNAGGTVGSLTSATPYTLYLFSNATQAGIWALRARAFL